MNSMDEQSKGKTACSYGRMAKRQSLKALIWGLHGSELGFCFLAFTELNQTSIPHPHHHCARL